MGNLSGDVSEVFDGNDINLKKLFSTKEKDIDFASKEGLETVHRRIEQSLVILSELDIELKELSYNHEEILNSETISSKLRKVVGKRLFTLEKKHEVVTIVLQLKDLETKIEKILCDNKSGSKKLSKINKKKSESMKSFDTLKIVNYKKIEEELRSEIALLKMILKQ